MGSINGIDLHYKMAKELFDKDPEEVKPFLQQTEKRKGSIMNSWPVTRQPVTRLV